jgi:hypothetical protein
MNFYETDFWFITKLFMTGFVRPTPNDTVDGLLLGWMREDVGGCGSYACGQWQSS